MPIQESKSNIWNILTILSFGMLLLLTLASKPVEKLSAALTTKYEANAKTKVCAEIWKKQELYMVHARTLWMGGCMTTTKDLNIYMFKDNKKKIETIQKSWHDQIGEPFESIQKYCSEAYSALLRDHNVEEQIVSDLYKSQGCADRSRDHDDD